MDLKFFYHLLFFFLVINPLFGFGQENPKRRICPVDYIEPPSRDLNKKMRPEYDISQQEYHVIPTVIHMIHEGGNDSLSKELLKSQIEVLNNDFGRAGYYNVHPDGADTKIRFCLANRDPQGNPTDGINYVKTDDASLYQQREMQTKNLSRWPSDEYMNIWVVKSIEIPGIDSGTVQGYAYLPQNAAGTNLDGVVISHEYFGKNNPRSKYYDLGKTTTHEVGHYLNLFHPWGRSLNSGCNEDDLVDDTPLCRGSFNSPDLQNPCQPKPRHECYGIDRMTENYMEYSIDQCLKVFTQGQRSRMRNAIADYRSNLVSFQNVHDAGCAEMFDSLNSRPGINNNIYPTLEIFPNPAGDFIYISGFSKEPRELKLTFYSVAGRIVKTISYPNFKTDKIRFSLSDLSPGMYVLQTEFGGKKERRRLIIANDQ